MRFFEENLQVFLMSDSLDTDGDFARVRRCLAYVAPTAPDRALFDLIKVADNIVDENWENIGRLAERLRKKYRLSATQLDYWFDRHPGELFRIEPEMLLAA